MEDQDTQQQQADEYLIRVSAHSRATAVAGAIAGMMRERQRAEVQAIGAGAVNQAVKALAIARSYLEEDQIDIHFWPYFVDVEIEGSERTAMRFVVTPNSDEAAAEENALR